MGGGGVRGGVRRRARRALLPPARPRARVCMQASKRASERARTCAVRLALESMASACRLRSAFRLRAHEGAGCVRARACVCCVCA